MNVLEKILEETSNIYRGVESNEDLEWNRAVNKCQNIIHGCMEDIPDIAKQANDILEKLSFFYGQRAGRELWNDKPRNVQDEDIASFNRDIDFLRTIINDLNSKRCGWIPVEERLPEETDSTFKKFKDTNKWSNAMWEKNSEEVNITYELEDGTRKSGTSYTIDGKWRCEKEDRLVKRKVIAWQPLPESYKPKKHEKEHKNTQQEMEDFWNNK